MFSLLSDMYSNFVCASLYSDLLRMFAHSGNDNVLERVALEHAFHLHTFCIVLLKSIKNDDGNNDTAQHEDVRS